MVYFVVVAFDGMGGRKGGREGRERGMLWHLEALGGREGEREGGREG